MKKQLLAFLLPVFCWSSCAFPEKEIIREDFAHLYEDLDLTGSLVWYSLDAKNFTLFNKAQLQQPYTPASTFKICNSLIGLETGVIPDADYLIPWDSVVRNPYWDRDHDLRSAFANSVVWYYQELARRVGQDTMDKWLQRANYGNQDASGGIDQFWLTGGLRITPMQQIDFLQRLFHNALPFSQRSIDLVKDIMIREQTATYTVRGKTGWGSQGNQEVGWYVGYIETENDVYFFANCVQIPGQALDDSTRADIFNHARTNIIDSVRVLLNVAVPEVDPGQ